MKKILIGMVMTISMQVAGSQDLLNHVKTLIVNDSLKLRGVTVGAISKDTTRTAKSDNKLMTEKAVKDFALNLLNGMPGLAVKSNDVLSKALRVDDVIYNLIDRYTGERISLSRITGVTDRHVDTVMIFKSGNDYFKRVTGNEILATWFGVSPSNTGLQNRLALNRALAIPYANIVLPRGTIKIDSNLIVPLCASLVGAGSDSTILHFGSGVTIGLDIQSNNFRSLRNLQLLGNSTARAIGIRYGGLGQVIGVQEVFSVFVKNWTGAGAIGVSFRDIIKSNFWRLSVFGCNQNMYFNEGVINGTPTTLTFHGGYCGIAAGVGALIVKATTISFTDNFIFESNAKEGLLIRPGVSQLAQHITLDRVYFEDNGGKDTSRYQLFVDCSANGSNARVNITNSIFTGSSTTAKAIRMHGTGCTYGNMINNDIPMVADAVYISGGAYGSTTFPTWQTPSFVLKDPLGYNSDSRDWKYNKIGVKYGGTNADLSLTRGARRTAPGSSRDSQRYVQGKS